MRFNVVLVAIDTLRFDRVNSSRMPNLCSLLRESVFFTNHYSEAIPTHPSFTTIFTGVSPLVHGIVCHAGSAQLSPWLPMLPKLLNAASRSSCSCTTGTPTPSTLRQGVTLRGFTLATLVVTFSALIGSPLRGSSSKR